MELTEFPILGEISGAGTYHTVVPTWQAVPYPGEKKVPLSPGWASEQEQLLLLGY